MYSEWNFARAPFETFIFMDLEATGLPPSCPKITEISLLAVNRHSLENTQFSNSFRPVPLFPRVVDKLCLCVHPEKHFTPTAESITGLNNEILFNNRKQNFNLHIVDGMKAFLNRQCPPVCFVAHNGYRYDFPLLKAELSSHGVSLLNDVYCGDSLTAMRFLDSADNQFYQFGCQQGGRKKANYGLRDLYFKFFSEYPVDSHSAEADAIALIGVFQWRAKDLIKWMNLNATQFSKIEPMYKDIFQEEVETVYTPKRFRNTSAVQTKFTAHASEGVFSSDEFNTREEKGSHVRKRLSESQDSRNSPQGSSSASGSLGRVDHPANGSSYKCTICVLVLSVVFVVLMGIFQKGPQGKM